MNVNEEQLEAVDAWLQDKHCVLYLDWDISDPKQRRQAAEFVLNMSADLNRYLNEYWINRKIELLGEPEPRIINSGFRS